MLGKLYSIVRIFLKNSLIIRTEMRNFAYKFIMSLKIFIIWRNSDVQKQTQAQPISLHLSRTHVYVAVWGSLPPMSSGGGIASDLLSCCALTDGWCGKTTQDFWDVLSGTQVMDNDSKSSACLSKWTATTKVSKMSSFIADYWPALPPFISKQTRPFLIMIHLQVTVQVILNEHWYGEWYVNELMIVMFCFLFFFPA